ncbi:hypothetical protein GJ699_05640 [Duganella sp. FT80W]|uniref:Uncharacterized protein n=1 Tax=Duganella guangzhouensis TaxID=2666084 RepID=A0A6I2KVJ3_9BURK|nr:hypothetical protein [Duganella guangzhouensis]MRW89460.1 hypothetical protein [Duganella guangzhouensis]
MEARVEKLEDFATETRDRLVKIESRLEQTAANVSALQVEMHKGFAEIIKWMVGIAIALGATGITVITFVLNNATPKAPAQPPIVIYTSAQPPVAAPAPKP